MIQAVEDTFFSPEKSPVPVFPNMFELIQDFAQGLFHSEGEAFAEDDGELRFGLGPFTWRAFPILRQAIAHFPERPFLVPMHSIEAVTSDPYRRGLS
ncbi:hypothetical protein AAC691_09985 [Nguyenibacter vanlangensis]|uniref:Uncharacterized protein n=1 Tax=Nguyenibacter vanlangensis TaxID=1216886 RepID=A0ABZ3DC98_9PROT